MSNAEGLLGSRFDRSRATAGLALGDLLVLAGFLTAGSLNHGVDPVSMPGHVAGTIAPFLVGWVVASLVAGAYAPDATRTVGTAVLRAVSAWVPAAAIGLTLRSTGFFHGDSPVTFILVVTVVGIVCFSAWRAFAAYLW
ncbi:DUF3054 domain-containing protein [Halorussus limi]|uniref:DUF3054 domain-containing protein n=1 Tax=Halorussus limi TaxID=2938695 RepID=A0A8U0HRL7_9EURY|nr:DUF3054 domain-containing protein [Halorussus limi]UPV73376.1 DUF3054 domain-containing protein [Halorussus limi]